ncbi:MAG: hypothetical protein IPP78_12960 [Holophagaceae bacterium]|nr:hypothetical protein [Holophagaceae bacterium]
MRDSSWDNTGVARQGSRRPWLKWALVGIGVVFGLPILMTATIGSLALRHRAQVWPAVCAVHARLQTDEGARDLFVKNPALANIYASDQDFLDTVRTWRTRVGDLPPHEPPEGPTYSPDSDPGEAAASIQGLGGAWMLVNIRGGAFAGPIQGEGIDRIFFGEDKKALRTARKNANAIKKLREWDNFRKLMLQCGDDTNAMALYRREPGLRSRYPSETGFLESMKALRPTLGTLPAKPLEGAHEFSIHTFQSPFRRSRIMTFRGEDGQELAATWTDDQLDNLELRPSNRHR